MTVTPAYLQLRTSVVGQVNEAEAEVEEARAQAEQERQERRAQMHTLLADKADLEAGLQQQQQAARQLQVVNLDSKLQHKSLLLLEPSVTTGCSAASARSQLLHATSHSRMM